MNAKPAALQVALTVALKVALASLALLMMSSIGLVLVAAPGPAVSGLPPGLALAAVKVVALSFLFKRVWSRNVYSMQWSSMFILLFLAEGSVRAFSDPHPTALIGLAEAVFATAYFTAVLSFLRPLKQQARQARPSEPP